VCILCSIKVLIYFLYWYFLLKICYEFDFVREARAMERIREFLRATNKKPPVMVPRVIPGMVSRYSIITAHLVKVYFRLFNWILVLHHIFRWIQGLSLTWWSRGSSYKLATYWYHDAWIKWDDFLFFTQKRFFPQEMLLSVKLIFALDLRAIWSSLDPLGSVSGLPGVNIVTCWLFWNLRAN